ncbi:GntR family transcriptional regulator [Pelagibius litoralis]|uniref:GntR family transcriptional regulator n=1 Tax=Pelagibius litoralis TaxID=374515 RepID=A0A967KE65_9PROT|nr:GntR family transcriptional regulator [Pelagibius litoralis]NIA70590.1 GntR family transcriptional regulator [Pelagibius litoralis]
MARTDVRFRAAFNSLLDICNTRKVGDSLPSEVALADELGVSRTVVRAALQGVHDKAIIRWDGRDKAVLRRATRADRLSKREELASIEELEVSFLEWVLRFDVPPETVLNITQLSKQFSVAPHTLQEFLAGLARFGLVERRERGGWILRGFTRDFAVELSDFRSVLELHAIKQLVRRPKDDPIWEALKTLEQQHLDLLARIDTNFQDFSRLDEAFHTTINTAFSNRFVFEFQRVISLIFHYHFQWNKSDERQRNEDAIKEHLAYIDGLRSGDPKIAERAALSHLETSKLTLLRSLKDHNFS